MRPMYLRWENHPAWNCAACEEKVPEADGVLLIRVPTDKVYHTTGHVFKIEAVVNRNGFMEVRATPPLCGAKIPLCSSGIMTISEVPGLMARMREADREIFAGELSMLALGGKL